MAYPTQAGSHPQANGEKIAALVEVFRKGNGRERAAARERLSEIGEPAVPALMEALRDRQEQVRWEAAKALTQIPDPRAAEALVGAFKDSFGIRWLAGEALISIGEPAFVPIVRGLLADPDSPRVREAAHHVLTSLKRAYPENPHIEAILKALTGPAVTETVPWVARDILKQLGLIPYA